MPTICARLLASDATLLVALPPLGGRAAACCCCCCCGGSGGLLEAAGDGCRPLPPSGAAAARPLLLLPAPWPSTRPSTGEPMLRRVAMLPAGLGGLPPSLALASWKLPKFSSDLLLLLWLEAVAVVATEEPRGGAGPGEASRQRPLLRAPELSPEAQDSKGEGMLTAPDSEGDRDPTPHRLRLLTCSSALPAPVLAAPPPDPAAAAGGVAAPGPAAAAATQAAAVAPPAESREPAEEGRKEDRA